MTCAQTVLIMLTIWLTTLSKLHGLSRTMGKRPSHAPLFMSTTTAYSFPRVIVKRNRQSMSFREGNPLIFTRAIAYTESQTHESSLPLASLVQVDVLLDKTKHNKKQQQKDYPHYQQSQNAQTQSIGWGVFNPSSMYRVRMLCHSLNMREDLRDTLNVAETEDDALSCILTTQLESAFQVRKALGLFRDKSNASSLYTDTFRLINGEGDGLSGLAADVIGGDVLVVMSSAAWCQVHKDLIISCLKQVLDDNNLDYDIMWKTTPARLSQDGMEVSDEGTTTHKKEDTRVLATELGIQYATFPYASGQKTGYYCDQRENRWNLAQYCKDARVLDLCCYHGGFALSAVIHGQAAHATGVDSSQQAIDACNMNAYLNDCGDKVKFVRDDISKFMKEAETQGDSFNVIILDPPKLAPSISGLDRAKRKYHGLNRDALKLIDTKLGGLLMTCTCSAAMTQQNGGQYFLNMVQQAAIAAGRHITLLKVSGAAPCHSQSPASFPAGNYLTAAIFYVAPL